MNDLYRLLFAFVSAHHLAVEFDQRFYQLVQDDLAGMSDAELANHYEDHGRNEGRMATPGAHRYGFVAQIPPNGLTLEIGPAVRPVLLGPNIRYFDIADQAGLVARAKIEGYPADDCPVIHYFSPIGDLSVVPDKFEGVFSSHCIEHQPDLVKHLDDVANLLKPGGLYHLIIPDKRYCFDALLIESTIEEVVAAHKERRVRHSREKVIEHYTKTTHNDALRHWKGDSKDPRIGEMRERKRIAELKYEEAKTTDGYVDVHAWQFTPSSFRTIINALNQQGLCRLAVERVYDTVHNRHEFCAVLKATSQP